MDDDAKKREPGCECHQEEGDSPCPVHGLEEDADVAHRAEIERLKARVAELESKSTLAQLKTVLAARNYPCKPVDLERCLSERCVERLGLIAKASQLEAERDAIAGKLWEAIELAGELMPYVDDYFRKKWGYKETQAALKAYHTSLTQGQTHDRPSR